MYYNFVDLSDASPIIWEAVEDMQILGKSNWNYAERIETNRMLSLFNRVEDILAEVMTMKSDDKKMFLLKMAVYRFCTFHLPKIMKIIEEQELKDFNFGLEVGLNNEDMKQWEKGFWGNRTDMFYGGCPGEEIASQRERFRREKPIKESDYQSSRYSYIPETIKLAYEDDETRKMVEKLEKNYLPLVEKVKNRNKLMKKNLNENTDILIGIQELRILMEIMEKDFKGELSVGDFMMIEEKKGEWMESIQNLEDFLVI